ncbi:DUF559 domain-containing protein [Fulvivirga sedimenti]|uniref:DUF559 domain-containing protein n=1 Tax=Fulvivirga sedimenti TaxID=2879465 RepID=A0A9X1HLX5_9BACT|nr:DUF559 domain-containing protein [Fulvivirga sedimenti]MCA6074578.1 DUF559 domain-containing protein [Fulvivirga sedimenti]MCA6075755.1 DUF559 domain-containing protein [Fulvivirga sedimenti]MCA6076883.1 DUF559 domain-containing protein [Fulvivirga sedimenti]
MKIIRNQRNHPLYVREHLIMWKLLNEHRTLKHFNFKQYHSFGCCTAQFCSFAASLVVELEGYEDMMLSSSATRDCHLKTLGFHILRYENYLVNEFPEIIIEDIQSQIKGIRRVRS